MMIFVHKQIGLKGVLDKDIHEHIGQRIFFHDRLIERWIRDIDLDVVSDNFSTMNSLLHASHCKQYIKQNILSYMTILRGNMRMEKKGWLFMFTTVTI